MGVNLLSGLKLLADKAQKELSNNHTHLQKRAKDFEVSVEHLTQSSKAYAPLSQIEGVVIANPEVNPWGFYYGLEELPSIVDPNRRVSFPLLYPFVASPLTAIKMEAELSHLLLNFALRAIACYPIGNSCVYMMDANIGGQFNQISPISTALNDQDSPKNFIHYISTTTEQQQLLDLLEERINTNITSFVNRHNSLYEYNLAHLDMPESYHFVFINDIGNLLRDQDLSRLQRMVYKGNAVRAGVYIFFSYEEAALQEVNRSTYDSRANELERLVQQAYRLELPKAKMSNAVVKAEEAPTLRQIDAVIDYVQHTCITGTILDFSAQIKQTLSQGRLWQRLPDKYDYSYITIPVGSDSSKNLKMLHLSCNAVPYAPHMFIGGKSGSGKTILLHNVILNASLRFSPELLRFYLVDMKAGVSLIPYKHLPHAEVVSASSNRLYALTVLERAIVEAERRGGVFKQLGVTNIAAANTLLDRTKQELLPFIVVIIDEYQELVKGTDSIAMQATRHIEQIHKKGRSQGVFIALCTQSLGGVQTDISQVGVKLSLITNPSDSKKLLGNEAASRLGGKKGRAILNTSEAGEERYNEVFQVAYIDETKDLPRYIELINACYQKEGGKRLSSLLFNEMDTSASLSDMISLGIKKDPKKIYVGIPMFCREEHCSFSFHRDSKSNVVVVGNDRQTAMRLLGSIILQFIEIYPASKALVGDLQTHSSPYYATLKPLAQQTRVKTFGEQDFEGAITKIHEELKKRSNSPDKGHNAPELLLVLADLRLNPALRVKPSIFGRNGSSEPSASQRLHEILELGPELGIHTIVYAYSMTNLLGVSDQIANHCAEIKIALRGGDSIKLLAGYGQGDAVEAQGQAKLLAPAEMGLAYPQGDLMIPYNTVRTGITLPYQSEWEKVMAI